MRTRFFLRLVLVVLPTVGIMLVWLAFLPHQGGAVSAADAAPPAGETAPLPTPTPDPRWVEIVRARRAAQGAAPEASLPTINLNLATGSVAGRVPSPAMVEIALLDQGQEVCTGSVLPVLDGGVSGAQDGPSCDAPGVQKIAFFSLTFHPDHLNYNKTTIA